MTYQIIESNQDYRILLDDDGDRILVIFNQAIISQLKFDNISGIRMRNLKLSAIQSLNHLMTSKMSMLAIFENPSINIIGIEKFISLTYLSIVNCDLNNDNLELISRMINLESLNIAKNQITSIEPIKKLIKLNWLSFYDNFVISTEVLAQLPELKWLSLSQNYNLSFEGLKKNPRFKEMTILYRVDDPRTINLYQLAYQEIDEEEGGYYYYKLNYNSKFQNYKFSIRYCLELIIQLIIRKKIILLWFFFFEEERRGGFNRFSYLAQ